MEQSRTRTQRDARPENTYGTGSRKTRRQRRRRRRWCERVALNVVLPRAAESHYGRRSRAPRVANTHTARSCARYFTTYNLNSTLAPKVRFFSSFSLSLSLPCFFKSFQGFSVDRKRKKKCLFVGLPSERAPKAVLGTI